MTVRVALAMLSCAGAAGYFGWAWQTDHRAAFLPGQTTHGHYQIELACETCHDPFQGVSQDACVRCHGAELEAADDSHPKAKFTDPRNADRLKSIDPRVCVTCHVEHRPEVTDALAVTEPGDYCFHCHSDIAQERPSHDGMAFSTCQDAGCHNFHDNRALSEDFLERHIDDPELAEDPRLPTVHSAILTGRALDAADHDAPEQVAASKQIVADWSASAHARAGVNCSDCHGADEQDGGGWVERPGQEACRGCHRGPVEGFLAGRHGMRLSQHLSPMRPELARQPMRAQARGRELGCSSCHSAHDYNLQTAAVDACLGCHADQHSLAYRDSKHAQLAKHESEGRAPAGSGVTCATCHLPRVGHVNKNNLRGVVHNQNDNLRPNEKMIRSVCQNCHGVPFAIDALADRALVDRNFAGRPTQHVKSVDMVMQKLARSTPSPRAVAARRSIQPENSHAK